jgi:hypothetical protein
MMQIVNLVNSSIKKNYKSRWRIENARKKRKSERLRKRKS